VSELAAALAAVQRTLAEQKATLETQVSGIDSKVGSITQLFTNDRARGNWGEISLLRILELGGLSEGRDFETQVQVGTGTADAVVHLPGDRRIVIDAKFPVARYLDALACDDDGERDRLLAAEAKELERVGKELAARGYAEAASGGYVVMYLPSQAVYEAAAAASPQVIEKLLATRVVVAGPAALFPILMSVGAILTEERSVQQADEILSQTRELHKRIGTFVGYLGDVGSHLGKTVDAFNRAVGSWTSRLSPQLARLSELSGNPDPQALEHVDGAVREVPAEEYELRAVSEGG
ncbi:MAG: DNA recombination protein RmuC, partial [Acidimicrobiia bacterium]